MSEIYPKKEDVYPQRVEGALEELKSYWAEISKDGWEPTDTGWVLTIGVILFVEWIGLTSRCTEENVCTSKADGFLLLKSSEIGDSLAGIFSMLAFIWIIVTVFMQRRELNAQRLEFRVQIRASREAAIAATDQSKLMRQQTALLLEAEQRRDQSVSIMHLNSLLVDMVRTCELIHKTVQVSFERHEDDYAGMTDSEFNLLEEQGLETAQFFGDFSDLELDERVYSHVESLMMAHVMLMHEGRHGRVSQKASKGLMQQVYVKLEGVFSLVSELPNYELARLNSLKLDKFKDTIEALLELHIWMDKTK